MFGILTILSLHEGHFMLCNEEEFQKFCEYEFIICYFVSHALIKTTRTSGALPKVGENRLRDQPKEYRGHRQTEKRRLIDLSAILKALFPFPVAFLRQITCHIEVLMVSIFSVLCAHWYLVVTAFGILVDSTQGHKTT